MRDSTRLGSSPSAIWLDIVRTNEANIRPAIDALIEALVRLRDEPEEALTPTFERAAHWRAALDAAGNAEREQHEDTEDT